MTTVSLRLSLRSHPPLRHCHSSLTQEAQLNSPSGLHTQRLGSSACCFEALVSASLETFQAHTLCARSDSGVAGSRALSLASALVAFSWAGPGLELREYQRGPSDAFVQRTGRTWALTSVPVPQPRRCSAQRLSTLCTAGQKLPEAGTVFNRRSH